MNIKELILDIYERISLFLSGLIRFSSFFVWVYGLTEDKIWFTLIGTIMLCYAFWKSSKEDIKEEYQKKIWNKSFLEEQMKKVVDLYSSNSKKVGGFTAKERGKLIAKEMVSNINRNSMKGVNVSGVYEYEGQRINIVDKNGSIIAKTNDGVKISPMEIILNGRKLK